MRAQTFEFHPFTFCQLYFTIVTFIVTKICFCLPEYWMEILLSGFHLSPVIWYWAANMTIEYSRIRATAYLPHAHVNLYIISKRNKLHLCSACVTDFLNRLPAYANWYSKTPFRSFACSYKYLFWTFSVRCMSRFGSRTYKL